MHYVEMRFAEANRSLLCRLYKKESKKLVVFFSALRPSTIKTAAFYNRLTWVGLFPYNCLYIADPTLLKDRSLRGGYYQGTMDWYGAEYCAEVILKIAAMLNILEEDILLYGSSQGGFASLATYAFMRKSRVLGEGPQVDLAILTSAKLERLNMLKSVYNEESFSDLSDDYSYRTNIIKLYEKYPPILENINILVKETDYIHINDHLLLFKTVYQDLKVNIITGEKGLGGHSAIDKHIIKDKVDSIFNKRM